MTKRDPKQVEYQPPGSSEWQPVSGPPKLRRRSEDRELARKLLARGEEVAEIILRRSLHKEKKKSEVEGFERDMAAAMGNFERMVAAGARKLAYEAEDALRDLLKPKK
jgi:hypothetical protein